MKIIKGDLLALAEGGRFDAIVHGCNCFHTMGAGIAAQIRRRYPAAFEADKATPYGDARKLGRMSSAEIWRPDGTSFRVLNAYTQHGMAGPGEVAVNYDAVRMAFQRIARVYRDRRVGYPMIGAGLGGGDWATIAQIIDDAMIDHGHHGDHALVVLPKAGS